MTAVPIDGFRHHEPSHRRTHQPVRRNSRPAAARENWRPLPRSEANRRILALKVYQARLRKPGQRWGAAGTISPGAIGLFELLCNMAVKNAGRLEPSAAWLARARNVPVKVIHAWKAQLKAHGFLDWKRRYVETGREGIRGPQVEQTTNAYWTAAPAEALAAVDKLKPPPSADMDTAREDRWRQANPELAERMDRLRAGAEASMARRDRFRSD